MLLTKLCRFIDRMSTWGGKLASIMLLSLILLLLLEVCLRYFLNSPTAWISETTQYLFGICFLTGGAYTLLHKGHVRVDILVSLLPRRTRYMLGIFSYAASIVYLLVLLKISGERAFESLYYLEQMDSTWRPYTFPVLVFVPIGVLMMILQAISMIIKSVRALREARGGEVAGER